MNRSRIRAIISATLAAAMGWSTSYAPAQDGQPKAPARFSAPAPPQVADKDQPQTPNTRTEGDEPDTALVDGRTVETIRERCSHGHVRLLRQVAQDAEGNYYNHGIWKRWDEDGHLTGIGDFREGQRHGHWEQVVFAQSTALLKQSPYREFAGPFLSEATFDRGRLHGKWIISDADGRKVSEIELSQGVRQGTATWYYPNGVRFQEIHYVDGQLEGDLVRWSNKGAEVSRKMFKQGREVVVKSAKYDNGQIRSQHTMLSPALVTETPDDWGRTEFVKYHVSGEQVKQGVTVQYHPNGQRSMEGTFQSNEPVGKHSWWHLNGQKSIEGTYRNGKPDGPWTWWHADGTKSTAGEYAEGTPTGEWVWWNGEGKVVQRASLGGANSPSNVGHPIPQIGPLLDRPESTSKLLPEPPEPNSSRRR